MESEWLLLPAEELGDVVRSLYAHLLRGRPELERTHVVVGRKEYTLPRHVQNRATPFSPDVAFNVALQRVPWLSETHHAGFVRLWIAHLRARGHPGFVDFSFREEAAEEGEKEEEEELP